MWRGLGRPAIDYKGDNAGEVGGEAYGRRGSTWVYDTVGGATIDASFVSVTPYTEHAVSCPGWSTHSLAPLSFRGATHSGVFTLMPLLTGYGRTRLRMRR